MKGMMPGFPGQINISGYLICHFDGCARQKATIVFERPQGGSKSGRAIRNIVLRVRSAFCAHADAKLAPQRSRHGGQASSHVDCFFPKSVKFSEEQYDAGSVPRGTVVLFTQEDMTLIRLARHGAKKRPFYGCCLRHA
ncbi:hypothetical protein KCP73_19045 [Salmonella enterica subsp. enterica]|nr:hypothetical protein KCP73_19045 [Salmonella enterica subsp. enterica]